VLTKYFEDQKKKTLCKLNKNSCNYKSDATSSSKQKVSQVKVKYVERKEYLKKYIQVKRTDPLFKEKERQSQASYKKKKELIRCLKRRKNLFRLVPKGKQELIRCLKRRKNLFRLVPKGKQELIRCLKRRKNLFRQVQNK